MSDLQLTIIRSPLNTPEPAEQTDAKINGRTIEQDDNHAKRARQTAADEIWEYALENPLDCRDTSNINVHTPEASGRLIVQFPELVLIKLLTHLYFKDIRALICLCRFGNATLNKIFFTKANFISNNLFGRNFLELANQSQTFTLKLLDAPPHTIDENKVPPEGQAVLDEIYTGLQGDETMTIQEIRDTFDEFYFKGDEIAFMHHVASFNNRIYRDRGPVRNLVERFMALKSFIQKFSTLEATFTSTERSFNGNAAEVGFFPLRIIQDPKLIEKLGFYEVEFATLPPQIKDCVNLKELHVENLKSLPPEIGQLTSLTRLTAESLNMTSLPAAIVNLTKLTYINLVDPTGSFPLDEEDDDPPGMMITFDSLTNPQQEWILTLQRNGCVIEMMNVPPQE